MTHRDWSRVNGNYRILSFDEWFIKKFYNLLPEKLTNYTRDTYNKWKDYGVDEIRFVNYYIKEDKDLLTELTYVALPRKTHTCSKLRE